MAQVWFGHLSKHFPFLRYKGAWQSSQLSVEVHCLQLTAHGLHSCPDGKVPSAQVSLQFPLTKNKFAEQTLHFFSSLYKQPSSSIVQFFSISAFLFLIISSEEKLARRANSFLPSSPSKQNPLIIEMVGKITLGKNSMLALSMAEAASLKVTAVLELVLWDLSMTFTS